MAFSPVVFAAVLKAVEEELGPNLDWTFTEAGKRFEETFLQLYPKLTHEGLAKYVATKTSRETVKPINRFLKKKGFSIRLDEMDDPLGIACAAVIDILVNWKSKGKKKKIKLKKSKNIVPGVQLEDVEYLSSPDHPRDIAQLMTQSDVNVFVTEDFSDGFDSPFDLLTKIESLNNTKALMEDHNYSNAYLPMVDLSHEKKPKWLIGTTTQPPGEPTPFYINKAKSQHILRLNEEGAKAKAAAAIEVLNLSWDGPLVPRKPYIINTPYLIWFELDDMVLFCARVDEDVMREPASL
ncbi:MAG: hypothetical protein AB8F95_05030 [Bacteroidia bacterium]